MPGAYDVTSDELTRDQLTADIWLWQRRKGHRFSSDDVITAWFATQQVTAPARVLDLGCGIGSVLLHLAWCYPEAMLCGIEAQAISFGLLQRNVDDNGLRRRIVTAHGDLREAEAMAAGR